MKTSEYCILNANQAVARMAYQVSDVIPIYPITPASEMSELAEKWNSENKLNIFQNTPSVFQMQSEGGVAGAMHGAIQTGSLSTTFTSSQGLLLMLPNMYKIAGELTPNVIHVATRSIATHALSIFGDHSDVMAVRQSGYAMLASANTQEAHDFALISHASSLETSIPFVHFFDGFRTSHEINKIKLIQNDTIQVLINREKITQLRQNALNPNHPIIRGTAQGLEIFFQSREASNSIYNTCPDSVQNCMDTFSKLTGRSYKLFDYVGHENAEYVIITMASSTDTVESTVQYLNEHGGKYGLIKVRLFRPFSTKHLIDALPKSVKSIAVLDRTKEPGSIGEPLYLDITQSLFHAYQNGIIEKIPRIVGGRYGLSSKEFTPSMVHAIYKNLELGSPKNNFTVGILDDVTNSNLCISKAIHTSESPQEILFYQDKTDAENKSFHNLLKTVGNEDNTFVQGYIQIDYKKSNTFNIAHFRINEKVINAPYLIDKADFIGCQSLNFLRNCEALQKLKQKGNLLINSTLSSNVLWQSLTIEQQNQIISKELNLYLVNFDEIKFNNVLENTQISLLHACYLSIMKDSDFKDLSEYIYLFHPAKFVKKQGDLEPHSLISSFDESVQNSDIPVSLVPIDGTFQSKTKPPSNIQHNYYIPDWEKDQCSQCGLCSMACPQAALRTKVFDNSYLNRAPKHFKHIDSNDFDLMKYTIQINSNQCNGCNNCVDACPENALVLKHKNGLNETDNKDWSYFKTIPEFDRTKINPFKISEQQLQEPLFKYPSGTEGCGEAPYLKLLSQLYGNRLLIANATGASSIFGGAYNQIPWYKDKSGKGPAWSNSLFEDNAEFGLGFRKSIDNQSKQARVLLEAMNTQLNESLVNDILSATQNSELEINELRQKIEFLKKTLKRINSKKSNELLEIVDSLVEQSVWIVGGDGWAYDIGYGGLDHVIASGENVNILVLDNEVYDNTGGQMSKSTPYGAKAKFANSGKKKQKKDLGLLAMTYDNVYVASVAIGANQEQTLKAFNEAESFDGPSLIIAYCHSASHGINMNTPSLYHKAAVNSGQWLLYRRDPRHTNEFQLDSRKPTIKIQDYLKLEKRFEELFKIENTCFNNTIEDLQKKIDRRFDKYSRMSNYQVETQNTLPTKETLLMF